MGLQKKQNTPIPRPTRRSFYTFSILDGLFKKKKKNFKRTIFDITQNYFYLISIKSSGTVYDVYWMLKKIKKIEYKI